MGGCCLMQLIAVDSYQTKVYLFKIGINLKWGEFVGFLWRSADWIVDYLKYLLLWAKWQVIMNRNFIFNVHNNFKNEKYIIGPIPPPDH